MFDGFALLMGGKFVDNVEAKRKYETKV